MRDLDGLVPIAFPHNSSVTPTEIFETQSPIRIEEKRLLPDSAGPGRSRGGPGQVMTFVNAGNETVHARVRPDKITCAPPGLDGGSNGKTGEVWFNGEQIHRFPILDFHPGDRIELRMPGGAGFGPVQDRPHHKILHDLETGIITPHAAVHDYHLPPEKLPEGVRVDDAGPAGESAA